MSWTSVLRGAGEFKKSQTPKSGLKDREGEA